MTIKATPYNTFFEVSFNRPPPEYLHEHKGNPFLKQTIPFLASFCYDKPMELQVGVKALLQNGEGKYLLLRRSLIKYPDVKGRWDIVGGRIFPGTTLLENLRREVREETGLDIVGNPRLKAAQDILRTSNRHVVRLTYMGEATGEIVLDTNENDTYQWFTKEELIRQDDVDIYFKDLLDRNLMDF